MLEVIAFAVVFLVLSEIFASPRKAQPRATPRKVTRKVTHKLPSLPKYRPLPGNVSEAELAQARYWEYIRGAAEQPIPTQYELNSSPIK